MPDLEDTNDQGTEDTKATKDEPKERVFTQREVEQIVQKRTAKLKSEIESLPSLEEFTKLKEQLSTVVEERELEGKTRDEKLAHQHAKELEKHARKVAELNEQLTQATSALEASQKTLEQERVSVQFGAALNKAGVHGPAATDALRTLVAEIADIERGEDGSYRASYGNLIDESPEEIAKEFLNSRPYFAKAPVNGAGTRSPSGHQQPPGKLEEMTIDQLAELAGDAP